MCKDMIKEYVTFYYIYFLLYWKARESWLFMMKDWEKLWRRQRWQKFKNVTETAFDNVRTGCEKLLGTEWKERYERVPQNVYRVVLIKIMKKEVK